MDKNISLLFSLLFRFKLVWKYTYQKTRCFLPWLSCVRSLFWFKTSKKMGQEEALPLISSLLLRGMTWFISLLINKWGVRLYCISVKWIAWLYQQSVGLPQDLAPCLRNPDWLRQAQWSVFFYYSLLTKSSLILLHITLFMLKWQCLRDILQVKCKVLWLCISSQ